MSSQKFSKVILSNVVKRFKQMLIHKNMSTLQTLYSNHEETKSLLNNPELSLELESAHQEHTMQAEHMNQITSEPRFQVVCVKPTLQVALVTEQAPQTHLHIMSEVETKKSPSTRCGEEQDSPRRTFEWNPKEV